MKTVKDIIARIESFANPEKVLFKKKKFGIVSNNALGVMHSDLNAISREIDKNEQLAKALFDNNVYEARILCAKLFPPKKIN
jgi:3-methyladenine DNA glycosylase AlkD